jgi:hypothetical protein
MEWFEADASATWGLGTKNLYFWQKPWHGWGDTELRVIRYENIRMMPEPATCPKFLFLSLDFDLPQPRTEWLRLPDISCGMTAEKLAMEIVSRASSVGREVKLHTPKRQDPLEERDDNLVLSPSVGPAFLMLEVEALTIGRSSSIPSQVAG